MTAHALTSVLSLRHVTFEVNICQGQLRNWIFACQPAVGLTSLTIKLVLDTVPDYVQDALAISNFRYPASSPLCSFLSSRGWKHVELPGQLVGISMFNTLACLGTLESLTLTGPMPRYKSDILPQGRVFKSLHTLRMQRCSNGETLFKNILLPSVKDLTLEFGPPPELKDSDCPISYLATMTRACPNARNVEVSILYTKSSSEEPMRGE
jgi:hypothetical protein